MAWTKMHEERATRLWHEGTIGIPENSRQHRTSKIARYWVKAYDEGSEYGIEEGRISKMTITIDGETVCNYDRGWDVYPETEEANIAYAILMTAYN